MSQNWKVPPKEVATKQTLNAAKFIAKSIPTGVETAICWGENQLPSPKFHDQGKGASGPHGLILFGGDSG
eukprot:5590093-Amphidinium_carterae.1